MSPRCTAQHIGYGLARHAELVGDALVCQSVCPQRPNHVYLLFGQDGLAALFTARVPLVARVFPPLLDGVLNVVFPRAGKQVRRADTGGIVATVAEVKAGQDVANGQLVGDTVRPANLPIPQSDSAVSMIVTSGGPFPALPNLWAMRRNRPVLVNLGPEAIRQRHALGSGGASLGAKLRTVLQPRGKYGERLAALRTRALNTVKHAGCIGAGVPTVLAVLAWLGVKDCAADLTGVSMARHDKLQSCGATPRLPGRSAGTFCCLNYTIWRQKKAGYITLPAS